MKLDLFSWSMNDDVDVIRKELSRMLSSAMYPIDLETLMHVKDIYREKENVHRTEVVRHFRKRGRSFATMDASLQRLCIRLEVVNEGNSFLNEPELMELFDDPHISILSENKSHSSYASSNGMYLGETSSIKPTPLAHLIRPEAKHVCQLETVPESVYTLSETHLIALVIVMLEPGISKSKLYRNIDASINRPSHPFRNHRKAIYDSNLVRSQCFDLMRARDDLPLLMVNLHDIIPGPHSRLVLTDAGLKMAETVKCDVVKGKKMNLVNLESKPLPVREPNSETWEW